MRSWVARHLVALGNSLRILTVFAAVNLPADVFEVLDLMAKNFEASIFRGLYSVRAFCVALLSIKP